MKPILYAKNASSWANMGIGTLGDCIKATATEKRNGAFELEIKYPTGGTHYSEIEKGMLIKAKPNDFANPQMFRIYKITKPMSGQVTIKAEHISYELNGMTVPSLILTNTTASAAGTAALTASVLGNGGYTFWSNISTRANVAIRTPRSMRGILGGDEGSLLDVFGGEYEFDNRSIKLYSARGADRGVVIKYGRNLTDLQQDESIEQMYTHVYAYARVTVNDVDTYVGLPGDNPIDLGTATALGYTRCLSLDLTDEFETNETITSAAVLIKANAYIAAHNLITPTVSLTVSFYALRNSDEYKDLATLEQVKLCDTVHVEYERLGVTATAKVISTTYDVLLERYDSIELGDTRSSFSETVRGQQNEIDAIKQKIIPTQISRASAVIDAQTKAFAEKMYNGLGLYSTIYNGITYFHDTPVLQDADYIITISTSGVAFAKTVGSTTAWNNGNPNWLYGVDADGGGVLASLLVRSLIADIITSGRLQSVDGSVYFDLDNALIHTETTNDAMETDYSPKGIRMHINQAEPQTLADLIQALLNGALGIGVAITNNNQSTRALLGTMGLWLVGNNTYTRLYRDNLVLRGYALYYKAGDTYDSSQSFGPYAYGYVTGSAKDLHLIVSLPKIIPEDVTVTVTSLALRLRVGTGGWLQTDGFDASSYLSTAAQLRKMGNALHIRLTKSDKWTAETNQTFAGQVDIAISFS